jgi:hypothetical protein
VECIVKTGISVIVMNLGTQILQFFGRLTAIGVAMEYDFNSLLFQRPQFIVDVYDSPVVCREGNVKCDYMKVFIRHVKSNEENAL